MIFIAILFVSCASELSLEAQRIVFLSQKPLDCVNLGRESGSIIDGSGAMSIGAMRKSAENDLRERVAKIGGDTIYIFGEEKSWNDALGGYELIIKGEVYKCAKDSNIDSSESNEK